MDLTRLMLRVAQLTREPKTATSELERALRDQEICRGHVLDDIPLSVESEEATMRHPQVDARR